MSRAAPNIKNALFGDVLTKMPHPKWVSPVPDAADAARNELPARFAVFLSSFRC